MDAEVVVPLSKIEELFKHAQEMHDKKTTYLCITCDGTIQHRIVIQIAHG